MNVRQRPQKLIAQQLYNYRRDGEFLLVIGFEDLIHSIGHVVHDQIKVLLILVVLSVMEHKSVLESNDVRMLEMHEDLQFSVLELDILINLLDCDYFTGLLHTRLVNNPK